jgi:hypothetical protein
LSDIVRIALLMQTMRFARRMPIIAAAVAYCVAAINAVPAAAAVAGPRILTQDVERFYRVYDAADGHPTEAQLQRDYIDAGSDGLHQFTKVRDLSGATLAQALAKHPADYAGARRCADSLGAVRRRLTVALRKLGELYPEARYPPVTILIGRDNTGGTTTAAGVLIGLETICRANWLEQNIEDRLVHLGYRIAKSYYRHASDKRAALRDIIQVQDAKAFLAKSGWFPGIMLP